MQAHQTRRDTPPRRPAGIGTLLRRLRGGSADQLRQLQATLDLGAFMARDLDGTIRHWSEGCRRLYGWTATEAVGRVSHELFDTRFPVSRNEVECALDQHGEWVGELSHRDRDGARIAVMARMALRRAPNGRPLAVMESVADLSRQRQAEAALASSEARFSAAASAMPGFLFIRDASGHNVYVNEAMSHYTGLPTAALLGAGWIDSVHPEDREQALAAWAQIDRADLCCNAAYRFRRHDGAWRWHQVRGQPHRTGDTGAAASRLWVGTCTDIHDRKLLEDELRRAKDTLEQQVEARTAELRTSNATLDRLARHLARARDAAEQANRAKSRFLASMSHELRTPLNGVLGYAQLLRMGGELNPEQERQVAAMLGAGRHLLGMINRVLTLSEIEADRAETATEPMDPAELARTCLDIVGAGAQAKGLFAGLSLSPSLPRAVLSDAGRLRQIVLNLLGNAVKFTDQGGVTLAMAYDAGAARLRIAVTDTGPGIPPEKRHLLFQDFERLQAEAGQVEGSGLGLALSARLAALLGGSIGAEPNPAGGSVFWVELPAEAALHSDSGPEPAPASGATAFAPAAAPSLRLLLVDDVAMNRDIACAFLRAAGHDVLCAGGGPEAVERAGSEDFDAVLMDVCMPGIDGLEATRRIRALAGTRGDVPILAMTAQVFADQIEACRRAGMDHHLAKPFTPETLAEALRMAVGKPRPARVEAPEPPPAATPAEPGPPVFDEAVFLAASKFLAPEQSLSYLGAIAGRGRSLLGRMAEPAASETLAADAHALAGCAGIFGFTRLAEAARRYEWAERGEGADKRIEADALARAIALSLDRLGSMTGETRPHAGRDLAPA